MSFTASALVVSWAAIGLLALAMGGLLRQVRELSRKLESPGMPLESDAPRVVTELGELELSSPDAATFVLFVDANCSSCREVVPHFATLAASMPHVNFVTMYERDAIVGVASGSAAVLTDASVAFARLRIPMTPFVAVAGHDFEVVKAAPVGSTALLDEFVASAIEEEPDEAAA